VLAYGKDGLTVICYLYRQDDNVSIRRATNEEVAASIAAALADGGCGWIVVDVNGTPTTCYAL